MGSRDASAVVATAVTLAVLAAGCGGSTTPAAPTEASSPTASSPVTSPAAPSSPVTTAASPSAAAPWRTPPPWLGQRPLPLDEDGFGEVRRTPPRLARRAFTLPDTVPALPGTGFAARVTSPAPARVVRRSTWAPGCPVHPEELAWLRVAFRGFDGDRHTGELLVHRAAARDLVEVFRELYRARFPIEEMRITTRAELDAHPTGDGNNTGAFVCRPVRGQTSYSQHAYGLAVDLNPFQNPYVRGELVLPELASAFLDRGRRRPGMIAPDGAVVRAFAGIGWGWGGHWQSLKDYQHFSRNGR